jgi:hypothetical protein
MGPSSLIHSWQLRAFLSNFLWESNHILILQLRLRKFKTLAQGHTAGDQILSTTSWQGTLAKAMPKPTVYQQARF